MRVLIPGDAEDFADRCSEEGAAVERLGEDTHRADPDCAASVAACSL